MRRWLIEKLGGFVDTESAIQHILDTDDEEMRRQILTEAVKKLYNTISKDDVLRRSREGLLMFKGKILTANQLEILKNEAQAFEDSFLYRVLDTECKYRANEKMFVKSSTLMHLESGKVMTYLWDVIKTRVKQLSVGE